MSTVTDDWNDPLVKHVQTNWRVSSKRAAKIALLARLLCGLQTRVEVPRTKNCKSTIAKPIAATNFTTPETVLLLGMVFATEVRPTRGQEYRDRVRCEALEDHGFIVRTLDDKHFDKAKQGKHCKANFCSTRRMLISMAASMWEGSSFDHVILDYFFSPVRNCIPLVINAIQPS